MTVRIVNINPHRSVEKEIICRNCGVTLAYVPDDIKRRDGHDYSGGPDGEEWVNCPNCKKKAVIRSW